MTDKLETAEKIRYVTNLRSDKSNIISNEEIRSKILEVFDIIENELYKHCGPKSNYAMIIDPARYADPVFTKDGINIVRSMEFINEISNTAKRIIAYIGKKIDKSSFDGTTTSMIIFISAIKHIIDGGELFDLPTSVINKCYSNFVKEFNTKYEDCIYTVDKLMDLTGKTKDEIIYQIAYSQAYTSSHGDTELAEVVAECFVKNQYDNFKSIIIERSEIESDNRFIINEYTKQFETDDVYPISFKMNNENLNTSFKKEKVDFLLFQDELNDGDKNSQYIMSEILRVIQDKESNDLVILTNGMTNFGKQEIIQVLNEYNAFDRVAVFIKSWNHTLEEVNDLLILRNIIVQNDNTPMYEVIKTENAEIECKNSKLAIGNLFERNEDGTHPFYHDKTKKEFHKLLTIIDNMIKDLEEDTAPNTIQKINRIRKVYSRIVYPITTSIKICGKGYDNISMIDVITDVVGATKVSLQNGFVPASGVAFYTTLDKLDPYLNKNSIFIKAFKQVLQKISDHIGTLGFDIEVFYDVITKVGYHITDFDVPWIIQPSTIDKVIIERFGESALKIIKTDKIVAIGGINLKEEVTE
jgi:hypothetical protein